MYKLFVAVAMLSVLINAELQRTPLYETNSTRRSTDIDHRQNRSVKKHVIRIKLQSDNENSFFGNISIGSIPQNFRVFFDTSSSNFWILSKRCSSNTRACTTKSHIKYDNCISETYISNNTLFGIENHGVVIFGYLSTDVACFGLSDSIAVQNQSFGEAIKYTRRYPVVPNYEGIVGMGYSTSAVTGIPVLTNMIQQHLLSRPMFSIYLKRDFSKTEVGELIIGDSNRLLYVGNLTYVNVTRKGYWQFNMDKVQIGNDTLCWRDCQAIIDSSNFPISGPPSAITVIDNYIRSISLSDAVSYVNCYKIYQLPNIDFTIGGKIFGLSGHDYIIQSTLNFRPSCMNSFKRKIILAKDGPRWFLGNVFLRRYYTNFDVENNRMGFAPAKQIISQNVSVK